ncbi:hypothetical protein AB0C74_17320 [Spirillospora sp. NPDC048832]
MPSAPDRGGLRDAAPERPGGPPLQAQRWEQSHLAVAAVALLSAAWAASAVLVIGVLASTGSRVWLLRLLDALVPGPAGPHAAGPGIGTGMALCALLLAAGALLTHTAPELLDGSRTARLTVWAAVPLLIAEPVRRAALALPEPGADVTVAACTLAVGAAALCGAALLALPAAGFRPGVSVPAGSGSGTPRR